MYPKAGLLLLLSYAYLNSNYLGTIWVRYSTFHGIKRAIRRKTGLLLEGLVSECFELKKGWWWGVDSNHRR